MSLRSPLGRVLGLGSAKEGTGHWWAQRLSAVALVPLTLWFFYSLLLLPSFDYGAVHAWLTSSLNGFLTALLVGVLAFHSDLGAAVIVEDYVHGTGLKLALLLLLRFAHLAFGGAAIFAIARIA